MASKKKVLRHAPLAAEIDQPIKFGKPSKNSKLLSNSGVRKRSSLDEKVEDFDNVEDYDEKEEARGATLLNDKVGARIVKQAREQKHEEFLSSIEDSGKGGHVSKKKKISFQNDYPDSDHADSESEQGEELLRNDEDYEDDDQLVNLDEEKDFVESNLNEVEEAVVQRFLMADKMETRSLADIILEKLREREETADGNVVSNDLGSIPEEASIPMKVTEVYTAVGQLLKHYKSGKLPKALKMLPHLKNWERILWLTRPDEWSAAATYAATRIFASNLNAKMAQRFYNLVLLEKCRDDIRRNNKLSYYLYLALKKALFKPAAFYKGLLLPLLLSHTCTLREATIMGSVLSKVSVPANHSAAVLLKLAEMPYYGSTSFFIRVLLNKKYALPRRVVGALVDHFCAFESDDRVLPVVWHQSLLVFAQRYRLEVNLSAYFLLFAGHACSHALPGDRRAARAVPGPAQDSAAPPDHPGSAAGTLPAVAGTVCGSRKAEGARQSSHRDGYGNKLARS
jgi:essential nuclear protein 1